MHRNPYMFRHVCDGFGDALFDPSCRICRKFEFFVRIEFLYCFDQSDIPFLDQIGEAQSRSEKSFGYADDQSQIGFYQSFLCLIIAFFDAFRDISLFFGIEQRDF